MIRPERESEGDAIFALHLAAFGRELEPVIVREVRGTEAYIPALSLVSVDRDDGVVGHVIVSWATLEGSRRRVLLLGPIAVAPDLQGTGIGGALVRAALDGARGLGEPCIVLEGDADYYSRFGFVHASPLGLLPPAATPDRAFQIAVLGDGTDLPQGRLVYPPGFPHSP